MWKREREEAMLYTDTQEVGGAWICRRSLLLAQKLTTLTQLKTHTANAQTHSHAHMQTFTHAKLFEKKKNIETKVTALIVSPPPHTPV